MICGNIDARWRKLMTKTHRAFLKKLHKLCQDYDVVLYNAEVSFMENMPATDELTGHYRLDSVHDGGIDYQELPLQTEEKPLKWLKF